MKSGCVCDEGFTEPAGGPCRDVNECTPNSGKGKGMGVIPHCNWYRELTMQWFFMSWDQLLLLKN